MRGSEVGERRFVDRHFLDHPHRHAEPAILEQVDARLRDHCASPQYLSAIGT